MSTSQQQSTANALLLTTQLTRFGTNFNDYLVGTNLADVIDGRGGNDTIFGQGGNDTLYGRDGNDVLDGGTGNDFLDGGTGSNTLYGRDGDDRLLNAYLGYGGIGNDIIQNATYAYGEAGNDTITGAYAGYGGAGNDNVSAAFAYGDAGDDILTGGVGFGVATPSLYGGAGNDRLNGSTATDYLVGGTGRDLLLGGAGNDFYYVYANDGVDTLTELSGQGTDSLIIQNNNAYGNYIFVNSNQGALSIGYAPQKGNTRYWEDAVRITSPQNVEWYYVQNNGAQYAFSGQALANLVQQVMASYGTSNFSAAVYGATDVNTLQVAWVSNPQVIS
jgi:Ca2+-binding RTX toxin-like protein